jgi:sentrin-specific protease 8
VLVIDATSEGPPRFIHHDSSDGHNVPAALKIAEKLRTIFPAAQDVEDVQTPRQQNGSDCAVYVMAIARSVTRWWRRREFEDDWMNMMWNEVNAKNVHTMRQQLAELLEKEQIEKQTNKPNSDLVDLQTGSFISDTVISNYFTELSSRLDSDEVLLVDAPSAIAYAQDSTSINPEHLRDRRIVVLPVNDTAEFGYADLGSHWSVLVIDATSEGPPRFIHHDSSDGHNLPAALNLAKNMRTIFPGAQEVEDVQTPRQENGSDCAVYVMAIARSITTWWRRRPTEEDWMNIVWNEVNAENVRAMRQQLAEQLEKDQQDKETKNAECKKDRAED